MAKSEKYLTVQQVSDELEVSYQKVIYMIKTGKIPAQKEGKAFRIPVNYNELIVDKKKEVIPKKKRGRPSNKAKVTSPKARKEKPQSISVTKKEQTIMVTPSNLISNLTKAIQDIVQFQVVESLNKKIKK